MGALLFDLGAFERSILTRLRPFRTAKPAAAKRLQASQFGIRHILIGTVLFSLLLGLLRALDLFSAERWLLLAGPWLGFASLLVLLSVLVAVGLWVVTSDGCPCLQAGFFLVTLGILGTMLLLLDALLGQPLAWLR
jgi:hypothetical protein